ncbi:MAG TPA: NAD(P)H-dependent oxidoreductase [Polyangiales bacterium]|nr:NAD(P)H-dependent oxidoreductase [Polyangiales bacterium]
MPANAPRILLVYASQRGGTTKLAEAVERGAMHEDNVSVRKLHGTLAGPEDLLWCDALVIATPENFGYMAGAVKDFFDRTFYEVQGMVDQLPYAVVVRAGNDGTFALEAVERIARGYPLRRVAEPVLWVGETEAPLQACEELGQMLAAGIAFGLFGRATRAS